MKFPFRTFVTALFLFLSTIAYSQCDFEVSCTDVILNCLTPTAILDCTVSPDGSYEYSWTGPNGFSSVEQNPEVSSGSEVSGEYVVTVKDLVTDCIVSESLTLYIDKMVVTNIITNVNCFGDNDGAIDLILTGGTGPFEFNWSTGATGQSISGLAAGIYTVSIVDADNCIVEQSFVISDPTPLSCTITGDGVIDCTNIFGNFILTCSGGAPPYSYTWSNGVTTPSIITMEVGIYTVTITDSNACTMVKIYTITEGETECGVITGIIALDENSNCINDNGEQLYEGVLVEAIGNENYYGFTDENGAYTIDAAPGTYTVSPILNEDLWSICEDNKTVNVADANDIAIADFVIEKLLDCPLMSVEISTPFLRRCFSGNYIVSYCNNGTMDAIDASVEVMMDELLILTNSSIPVNDLGNGNYEFEIGDVGVGECASFTIRYMVSCEAELGQTFCTEAYILPDDSCIENQAEWSGASISIGAVCEGGEIKVEIENVGIGDMNESVEYIVIEDGVMSMSIPGELQLNSGEVYTFSLPANGSTYRVEVNQVSFHPGNSMPSVTIEACGTNGSGFFSTGFVNQFSMDEGDEFVSIDCHEAVGSYDPNDKQAFPEGYGAEHFIERGQGFEYLIRFQNTGTDTAFTVRIEDVLSLDLDLATLRLGAASHSFELDIVGSDTLNFVFNNIMLPDSNINEAASHGFVQFSIGQKAGLELGTVIENNADIYFDFNEPVRTNTVFHTLGEKFILTQTQELFIPNLSVNVAPNPFSDQTVIQLKGLSSENIKLKLYNLNGQLLLQKIFDSDYLVLKKGKLSGGMYFYKIEVDGILGATGKLVID